jgi:hypothetical protein
MRAGCRIGRVRTKSGADVTILNTELKDTRFIRTLVRILEIARRGDVRSYAMVLRVENPDGSMSWIECADIVPEEDGGNVNMILGGIERMKARIISENPEWEL